MNRLLRCPLMPSALACRLSIWACGWPASTAAVDVGLGGALGCAEVGVGGAVGDPFQVAVDEAGVGLGFVAGVDLLVGELDEVGAALFGQVGGGREA